MSFFFFFFFLSFCSVRRIYMHTCIPCGCAWLTTTGSASHDILRLYDLRDASAFKHSAVPFLIVPGPPRPGVISSIYIDPTSQFMLSTSGTRGWDGTSTEVLLGYEINAVQ